MSLDKAIVHGKEYRKPYYGSKSFDSSCRNHGGCPWCLENRIYNTLKRLEQMDFDIKQWEQSEVFDDSN